MAAGTETNFNNDRNDLDQRLVDPIRKKIYQIRNDTKTRFVALPNIPRVRLMTRIAFVNEVRAGGRDDNVGGRRSSGTIDSRK